VNNLTNDGKYPLMVGNCCLTNAFDTGECFGEKLLRAENKGAVGYIGGSDVTYWNEDYWWGVGNGNITSNPSYNSTGPGAYDCTFHNNGENNWAVVNSTLMVAGNLGVVEAGSSLINYYWEIYHLMGDPSLSTYFGIPSENNLTHTEFLPVGSTSISISGAPYTYVGITHDGNILGSGQINPFGNIELNLSGATIPGTAQIVGTCQNHQPYFGEILIASPEGPYIMVESTSFTAGSGDDSGIIQFGETVDLSLNLENVGNDAANSVQVVLSTADQYVTLTNSSASTSYIASDGTATISGLEFVISTAVPNEYDFELICNISAGNETWESNLSFTAYAPVIEVDAVIGNLDPGVSANLDVHLLNTGGADIHSPMISIIGDSYVTVNSSSFTNAYVWFGGNNNNDETLSVSVSVSTTTPIGHIAEFIIIVNSDQSPTTEYEENVTFSIPVGQVIANFESGLGSLDWNLSCNGIGCTNWGVDNTESYTGSGSAQSGTIGNNQSSDMSVTLDITADGEIEFFYRVSAEYSSSGNYFYDGLEFYIDNTLKGQYQSTTSGGSPWTQVSYDVTEGEHTFRWSYIKDSSGGSTDCNNTGCEDAAWVDDIIFPPAYIESDGILGDLNGDSIINILDVIIMVNIILGVEPESSLADVNGDGTINILDIVQVINLILGPRVDNASSIQLHDTGYELRMKSDGYVGALKIVLKHDELFELNITEDALVSKAHTTQNFTTLVIVAPEHDHLFDYEGFFIIMEVEAANSEQLIPVALPFTTSFNSIFPNPFNPVTTIVYSIAKAGSINLSIYNLRGQLIEILENSFMDAGNYTVVWDASKQPSGIYFLQMKAENKIQNQKLMLVK